MIYIIAAMLIVGILTMYTIYRACRRLFNDSVQNEIRAEMILEDSANALAAAYELREQANKMFRKHL